VPYRRLVAAFLTTLAGLGVSACSLATAGDPATEVRDVADVTSVVLETTGDLVVTIGSPTRLEVTAGEKVIENLTSRVEGKTLHLGKTNGSNIRGDIGYRLTVPSIESVTVDGSGDARVDFSGASKATISVNGSGSVTAEKVDAQSVSAKLAGSGEATVRGKTVQQTVTVDKDGTYTGFDLSSEQATVAVNGSGSAQVLATRTLDAKVNGSGSITYRGTASVQSKVDGSGSISAG
jgi:hypothetical protein